MVWMYFIEYHNPIYTDFIDRKEDKKLIIYGVFYPYIL